MKKLFTSIGILVLALVSLAPLSVQAQSGRTKVVACYDMASKTAYAGVLKQDGTPDCTAQGTQGQRIPAVIDGKFYALCYKTGDLTYIYRLPDTPGKYECPTGANILVTCPSFSGMPATACMPKPSNTNTNTNTPRNTNGRTTTGGGGGGGVVTPCNPPEEGFHLVNGLCVPKPPFQSGPTNVQDLAVKIIRWMLFFAGIVAVIMIIIGGYLYMTARGNDAQATSGRKTLVNAIIGLIIVILSYVIVQVVVNFVTGN